METVLVTGSAGFIGSNFVRYLLKADPNVRIFGLDSLTYAGSLENLKGLPDEERHTFIRGDIRDSQLVNELFIRQHIDTVVHFAAESHVDRSIAQPAPFVQTNVVGTFTLLEAARQAWGTVKNGKQVRFHHVSTDEVFGSLNPSDPGFNESTPYEPHSPYAASKAGSDHLVRSYFHTYDLPVTISNCSNNYGPYQFPEKLIPLVILNALQGKPLPVYGDGQQIRDWLFVEDHCEAIYRVLSEGKPGETYNIGSGGGQCNLDVVHMLCDILDHVKPESRSYREQILHVADRPGHDRRYAMDIAKIQAELGWTPRRDLENGLRLTVRWYFEHQEWIDAILRQQGYQEWLEQNYGRRIA